MELLKLVSGVCSSTLRVESRVERVRVDTAFVSVTAATEEIAPRDEMRVGHITARERLFRVAILHGQTSGFKIRFHFACAPRF